MPTFNILLAHDVSHYGSVSVDAATWQEAVASLTDADWDDNCTDADAAWEERVVHVETEDGRIVAEDLSYRCEMVHYLPIIHRLTTIMDTCDVPDEAAAALVAYIDELRTMVRDPVFQKKETNQ